jgi:hypothetical protein
VHVFASFPDLLMRGAPRKRTSNLKALDKTLRDTGDLSEGFDAYGMRFFALQLLLLFCHRPNK